MSKKPDITFGYYIVAFIDLLGQKEAMAKFKGLPPSTSGKEYEEFMTAVRGSIGAIYDLQNSYKGFFSAYFKDTLSPSNLPNNISKLITKFKKTDIHFQHFSDGLVIYSPLMDNQGHRPISSVYAILAASASLMLLSLGKKRPIRGGLTIGLGAELNENELYGPVVAEAYKLESEVAQYPRIVVGEGLCNYLDHFKNIVKTEQPVIHAYDEALSDTCKGFLARDFDGYPIIDYMGDLCRESSGGDAAQKEVIKKANDFIISSLETFQKSKNSKLAIRYNLLYSYFQEYIENWLNDEPSTGKQ